MHSYFGLFLERSGRSVLQEEHINIFNSYVSTGTDAACVYVSRKHGSPYRQCLRCSRGCGYLRDEPISYLQPKHRCYCCHRCPAGGMRCLTGLCHAIVSKPPVQARHFALKNNLDLQFTGKTLCEFWLVTYQSSTLANWYLRPLQAFLRFRSQRLYLHQLPGDTKHDCEISERNAQLKTTYDSSLHYN